MKIDQLRKKSETDLKQLLRENMDETRELRFRLASGQLKDLRSLRSSRRLTARIKTILGGQQAQGTADVKT